MPQETIVTIAAAQLINQILQINYKFILIIMFVKIFIDQIEDAWSLQVDILKRR